MQILMLSSSRVNNCDYLAAAKDDILAHVGSAKECLFVPYAGVSMSYDTYTKMVQDALPELVVTGLHTFANEAHAIAQASINNQAILVGGGNTFRVFLQNLIGIIPCFLVVAHIRVRQIELIPGIQLVGIAREALVEPLQYGHGLIVVFEAFPVQGAQFGHRLLQLNFSRCDIAFSFRDCAQEFFDLLVRQYIATVIGADFLDNVVGACC